MQHASAGQICDHKWDCLIFYSLLAWNSQAKRHQNAILPNQKLNSCFNSEAKEVLKKELWIFFYPDSCLGSLNCTIIKILLFAPKSLKRVLLLLNVFVCVIVTLKIVWCKFGFIHLRDCDPSHNVISTFENKVKDTPKSFVILKKYIKNLCL